MPSRSFLPPATLVGAGTDPAKVVIVGGGPAGLMAAELLLAAGCQVDLFDAMPSVGRKFLLAGKGGLNLTHAEGLPQFVQRYGARRPEVTAWLERLSPLALRDWAADLGIATFVGSSGKVFPAEMKAAPLLRAWLHRLRAAGLRLHMRHRWLPESLTERDADGRLCPRFSHPQGEHHQPADGLLLALGGASWARLGSDGRWAPALAAAGVALAPFEPSNCGFDVGWSAHLSERHAGAPLKGVRLLFTQPDGQRFERLGEAVMTATGLEGNLIYAASSALRGLIRQHGRAEVALDLLPAKSLEELQTALARGRGARSLANHLKEQAGLSGVKAGLLREGLSTAEWNAHSRSAAWLAQRIKALPLVLSATRPIDEAISTAGGVQLEALSPELGLNVLPGVFCAGEMLDWEAPTGGYLLSAVMASGKVAAQGLLAHLAHPAPRV